ncbi:LytR/AlgR family response regulator transcription factor [Roseateles violae]|uniref:LytTR family DNA-binding domain-containing protein n=1 Tax=Roseateles violae TaxID=3058042 RepID=A0ABT8DUH0_9BURK|nr:LytTR family DNA-binding domain-containing protein [Pelomonas sp. PFR6]MDN3919964.1 LytTR family DNA-binding domain-containing protein [Pelomonas sp. PFR6]
MKTVFIAEDEAPARERLIATLARVAPEVQLLGHSDTVRGTLDWLTAHAGAAAPELLLLDIQLADGLSLELFRERQLAIPVIFTTAYDRFALQAFQALAVDYLLKPVSDAALAQALSKARLFRAEPRDARLDRLEQLLQALGGGPAAQEQQQRIVGRKGGQFHALEIASIACFVSLDKLSFAVDRAGQRFLVEPTLGELEQRLDPRRFFRANRQLLVAADAVRRFAAAGKGRLRLELTPALDGELLISQERAGAFRAWLER